VTHGARGRPPGSSQCACCGEHTDQRMVFCRSGARFYADPILVPICDECRGIVGRRRFLSVASLRAFVQYHLARRHEPFQLPAAEDIARLPTGMQRAAVRVIHNCAARNARRERRLAHDPNARKRA
jgi:hypothetical protein